MNRRNVSGGKAAKNPDSSTGGDSRVTSLTIAREAGVAQSTVSRVLNGGSVAESTRKRVLAVVKKYDFLPNQAARNLVSGRSGLIALQAENLRDPAVAGLISCLGESLQAQGCRVLLALDSDDPGRRVDDLRQDHVDGVVAISPSATAAQLLGGLARHDIPLLLVNPDLPETVTPLLSAVIQADSVGGGRLVAEHLAELGHTQVAIFSGNPAGMATVQKLRGFEQRFRELVPEAKVEIVDRNMTGNDAYRSAGFLLERLRRGGRRSAALLPSALFCLSDMAALAVLNAAAAEKVAVPEQLSLVGFGTGFTAELSGDNPSADSLSACNLPAWDLINLTTVCQSVEVTAATAATAILRLAGAKNSGPSENLTPSNIIPVSLKVRGSTARIGGRGHRVRGENQKQKRS